MRAHSVAKQLQERITIRENNTEGILNYDIDNAYPQRMIVAVSQSGIATTCLNWYRRFLRGQGFMDELFSSSVVNRKGITANQLLALTAKDLSVMQGFALHVNYNLNLEISEVNFMPFERTRLPKPDSNEFFGKIAVHKDWARQKSKHVRKEDIEFFDVFNPDPLIISEQIKAAGDISQYKGQILWVSAEFNTYPTAIFDSVLEDIDTDSGIKIFKNRAVGKGFKADHLFIHKGKFENDRDRDEFIESMEDFEGAENAASMLLVEVERDEDIPDIKVLQSPKHDKLFEHTESSIEENIRQVFLTPEVFIKSQPGKLGQTQQLIDSEAFYNKTTQDERMMLSEAFARVFRKFHRGINSTNDFKIKPFTFAS